MCGFVSELHRAVVEGSMLHICSKCLHFGEAIEVKRPAAEIVAQRLQRSKRGYVSMYKKEPKKSADFMVVSDYHNKVKVARQKMKITQDDLAKSIAERASVVQRVESGNLEPSLKLARKLQQFLRITLVQKEEASSIGASTAGVSSSGFTIGDLIKKKR